MILLHFLKISASTYKDTIKLKYALVVTSSLPIVLSVLFARLSEAALITISCLVGRAGAGFCCIS